MERLCLPKNNFTYQRTILFAAYNNMLKGNKVFPKTGVFHAQIHEINVNVSCSLSTPCASISGITGKIKLFPEGFISALQCSGCDFRTLRASPLLETVQADRLTMTPKARRAAPAGVVWTR